MSLIFLSATCLSNGPAAFTRTEHYWNSVTKAEESATSNELACQAYELAVGAQVDQYCQLDGTRVTITYKSGPGYLAGTNLTGRTEEANHPNCPLPGTLTLGAPVLTKVSNSTAPDGSIEVPFSTPHLPVVAVLSNGQQTGALVNGSLFFTGLSVGIFGVTVEDASGQQATLSNLIVDVQSTTTREILLRAVVTENVDQDNLPTGDYRTVGSVWLSDLRERRYFNLASDNNPPVFPPFGSGTAIYARPLTDLVDAYYLAGGAVYRKVYHRDDDGDGQGDGEVRFEDTVLTPAPTITGLRIDNIIYQHVHRAVPPAAPGPATGSVLLEASSSTPGPLTYVRVATGASNTTGAFGSLPAGPHLFRITDAGGNSVEVTITIEDRYRGRWFLRTFTPGGLPVQLDILGRDWEARGTGTELQGTGPDTIERSWATAGQDVEGVLPEAQGQSCRVTVRQQFAGQFADMFVGPGADDRAFRFDVHVAGQLVFRGYHLPDLYDEDLSTRTGGEITFIAGDGLGVLRSTSFLNHEALPLAGRWPLLNTVVHCLSRCECGPLPLYVQTDLAEVAQEAGTDWLPTFTTDRAGYASTGENAKEWTCRAVIEAILRPAHAVLVQRNGAWWIVSANAAGSDATFFAYAPNGELLPTPAELEPLRLKPSTYTTGNLFWLNAAQRAQTLAAVRGVVVSTKLLLVKNQLADGLLQSWQPDLLHPVGWTGPLQVSRLDVNAAEDTKPKAGVTKLRVGYTVSPFDVLTSPAIPFRAGQNEAPVRVALRLRVRPELLTVVAITPSTTNFVRDQVGSYTLAGVFGYYRYKAPNGGTFAVPTSANDANWEQVGQPAADVQTTVKVRLVVNGTPLPTLLTWPVNSKEKEVTVEGFAAFGEGLADGLLRLDLFGAAAFDLYEVTLQILPGAVEWPETDEITALNEYGFLVLPPVELHHADTPRLPLSDGTLRPVPTMDAFAWRHVLTYRDGTPTTAWRRSRSLAAAPLLETAGLDRIDLRRAPVSIFTGPVRGTAVSQLGFGAVVDAPQDAPGVRFWAVGVTVRDLEGKADVTLREIGLADAEPLPGNRLVTQTGTALVTDTGFVLAYA